VFISYKSIAQQNLFFCTSTQPHIKLKTRENPHSVDTETGAPFVELIFYSLLTKVRIEKAQKLFFFFFLKIISYFHFFMLPLQCKKMAVTNVTEVGCAVNAI
jgi:hypothetical protein